jgi:uncharacterized protein with FMN-binding domain
MKKVMRVLSIVFVCAAFIVVIGFLYLSTGLDLERQPKLDGIDPASVSDGTYTGQFKQGRFTNKLSVTVERGKITAIQIIDDVNFSDKKTSDTLFQRVIDQQNTSVDAVTGATVTSNAYLKAIENALDGQ